MDKKIFALNIFLSLTDFMICAFAIAVYANCAHVFSHWWIALFGIIPLALYCNHGIIFDSDVQREKLDALKPEEKHERE